MANLLINNFWGWIWDDPFLLRTGECLDMDWIDIITTPRKISGRQTFADRTYWTLVWTFSDTLNYVTETIDGTVQSYATLTYAWSATLTAIVAGADIHISMWSNLSDYNSSTNPEWIRHIFFTYDWVNNYIKIVRKNSWSYIQEWASISTSTLLPVTTRTTAVCYLWEWSLLFSRGNKIYELNPTTPAVPSTTPKVTLPLWAVVKKIFYFGWLVQFVYTIGSNTYIQGCSYDWTTFKLNTYHDDTLGVQCLDAVLNNNTIYWISRTGVYTYTGTSQIAKKFTLTSNAKCSYNWGYLRIIDQNNFYEYWTDKPRYPSNLSKTVLINLIKWVTEQSLITFEWSGKYYIDTPLARYKKSFYTLHPYTAGQFWVHKKWLGFRIGYMLPRNSYTDASVQATITVAIQTDDTYAVNTATFYTIDTISDKTKRYIDITPKIISDALWIAGYSEEFGWVKLKLTLNAWDPDATYGWFLFRKIGEVYDISYYHQEVEN